MTTNFHTFFNATAAFLIAWGCGSAVMAVQIRVDQFGDHGWKSDDTRSSAGTNLVGINNTHAGRPGQTPTAADDLAIATQIQFVPGPAGSTYGGAVSIDGTATGNGKSNYSVISPTTGFADADDLVDPSFGVEYEFYKQHTGGGSTLAFKLGIQSSEWTASQGVSGANPLGFTATRSGESVWDLVLVHVPAVVNNVWSTVNLDQNSGTWTLFRQAGNSFHPAPPPNGGLGSDKTLDEWFADTTWGPKLFGAGAKVSSIQFGLGSGQPVAIGYVDYLQTNLLNGGDVINFAAVPEPTSIALFGMASLAIGSFAARRRRRPSVSRLTIG